MRKSDPYHCNKCGTPLTKGGICPVEHVDPLFAVRRGKLLGQSHLARIAAPVSTNPTEEVA